MPRPSEEDKREFTPAGKPIIACRMNVRAEGQTHKRAKATVGQALRRSRDDVGKNDALVKLEDARAGTPRAAPTNSSYRADE